MTRAVRSRSSLSPFRHQHSAPCCELGPIESDADWDDRGTVVGVSLLTKGAHGASANPQSNREVRTGEMHGEVVSARLRRRHRPIQGCDEDRGGGYSS